MRFGSFRFATKNVRRAVFARRSFCVVFGFVCLERGNRRGKVGILLLDFRFSMAVVAGAAHFRSLFPDHAIFLCQMPANSLRFASCIAIAA